MGKLAAASNNLKIFEGMSMRRIPIFVLSLAFLFLPGFFSAEPAAAGPHCQLCLYGGCVSVGAGFGFERCYMQGTFCWTICTEYIFPSGQCVQWEQHCLTERCREEIACTFEY